MNPTASIQFYELTKDGRKLLGTLTLSPDKVIKPEPEPGGEQALNSVMGNPILLPDGTQLTKEEDPEKWFNRLPYAYCGSYFWASFA